VKQQYNEYKISTEPFVPDLISGAMWQLEIEGITEDDSYLSVFAKKEIITQSHINEILNKLVAESLINSFQVTEVKIENKNWNAEWEKTINIIKVNEKIIIKPTFREYIPQEDQIVLTIDPKMSFGTGEHQTTKLMLMMVQKYIQPGIKVLDAGTGTGILAIASVKFGASSALAFDNDEWCYENAIENCRLNSVEDKVEFRLAEINQIIENEFDLVLANINKNILVEISHQLKSKLKS
jgi:ribosomal protein L11 methyltransferase